MPEDVESGGEESELDQSEEDGNWTSTVYRPPQKVQELKVGVRKGIKKPIPLVSVKKVSRRMVLDDRYDPVTTRDRRQAYMPEVGQMKYSVPEVWLDPQEELQIG